MFKNIGIIAISIIVVLYKAIVIKSLWGWFVVTTFGLPALTVANAYGISLLTGILTYVHTESDNNKSSIHILTEYVTILIAVHLLGAIIYHNWM